MALMFLSAYCFVSWVEFVLIGFKIVKGHEYSVGSVAMMTGGNILYLGFAHALIALAAHQLGVDVRGTGLRKGAVPKGIGREWVLAILGTLVCIVVSVIGLMFYLAIGVTSPP